MNVERFLTWHVLRINMDTRTTFLLIIFLRFFEKRFFTFEHKYQCIKNKTPPHFGRWWKFLSENVPKMWGGVLVFIFFFLNFSSFLGYKPQKFFRRFAPDYSEVLAPKFPPSRCLLNRITNTPSPSESEEGFVFLSNNLLRISLAKKFLCSAR